MKLKNLIYNIILLVAIGLSQIVIYGVFWLFSPLGVFGCMFVASMITAVAYRNLFERSINYEE